MLDNNKWDVITLRDRRYDCIVHMVSTAIGAEEHYSLDNNPTRYETLEEARTKDVKTLNAWIGHPHVKIIDNSTNFEDKIKRVIKSISAVVGAPVPESDVERRYLLAEFPSLKTLVQPEFGPFSV